MDNYDVLSVAGEGSFGRVYKARSKVNNEIVAFKVIQKRGRLEKELDGLRQECEVQRHLHHPNIVQMLESFETENEIVVVSEFADRQLYEILGEAGFLPEPRVQQITCDLVAALFYLHSNRVLHRDLKPQNVLLSLDGTAKLCDFGFARSMSRGTMLLTSIKGTPLYMAPELVTESPYDHNADLWSLGCIVYELLVGVPPFSTTSILHLVRLIKHEPIRFPDFVSSNCVSFLQGLLQKDSDKRLTWPELLQHPFLEGKVFVPKDQATAIPPFTDPLSDSQQKVKESQRQQLTEQLTHQTRQTSHTIKLLEDYEKRQHQKVTICTDDKEVEATQPLETKSIETNKSDTLSPNKTPTPCTANDVQTAPRKTRSVEFDSDDSECATPVETPDEWEDPNPTQNDEWLDYLQRSMEEVMAGDLSCLLKPPLVAVATAPLARRNASSKVIEYVACLLSIPFVVHDVTGENITTLYQTYLESKIIYLLLQGMKTLMTDRLTDKLINVGNLRADQLLALERVCLLLSHLVHRQPASIAESFTAQLCEELMQQDAEEIPLLRHSLCLGKRKARVVADMLAVLTQILRINPQHKVIIQEVILNNTNLEMTSLLGHPHALVRTRCCVLFRLMGQNDPDNLASIWSPALAQRLEDLRQDEEHPTVQQAATATFRILSKMPFYSQPKSGTTLTG